MDAQELWQENKRWILCVLLGVILWWIADSVISSMYGADAVVRQIRQEQKTAQDEEVYGKAGLEAATNEQAVLSAARSKLEQGLVFAPSAEFSLAGKGDPDLHFDQVSRRVKRDLAARADSAGIELAEKDLDWTAPVGRQDIQATLIGVALIEQAVTRLFDAHAQVRASQPDALGLVGIDQFQVVLVRDRQGNRPRTTKSDVPDVQDLLREERVRFKLRCDAATMALFLEACHAQRPPISLTADFKVTAGRTAGDPLVAVGTLSALRLAAP